MCDGFLAVRDDDAVETARALARREGLLVGFSTGANISAAIKLAASAPDGTVVATVACDTGLRYLSTDLYPEANGGTDFSF